MKLDFKDLRIKPRNSYQIVVVKTGEVIEMCRLKSYADCRKKELESIRKEELEVQEVK